MADTKQSLQFRKVAGMPASGLTVGAIYFDKNTGTINVATSTTAYDKFGWGVKDATWENQKLTLTKSTGEVIELDFTNVASATSVGKYADAASNTQDASVHARLNQAFADINTKLNAADEVVKSVNTAADAGVALSHSAGGELSVAVTEGVIAENDASVVLGGQVYSAIDAAKKELAGQISSKNVSAEGDEYVSATAEGNKVTVAATEATKASLALADSALQKADITTGEANGTIAVDGADVAVKGLQDAAYATVESLNNTAKGYADTAEQNAKDYVDGLITGEGGLDSRIDALEAIDHDKLATDAAADAVATVLDGAPEKFDTLKEIAQWISDSETADSAANLVTRVSSLETTVGKEAEGENLATGLVKDVADLKAQDVYVKTTVDAAIADAKKAGTDAAAALDTYKGEMTTALAGKANVGDSYLKNETYTQTEVNNLLSPLASKTYVGEEIAKLDAEVTSDDKYATVKVAEVDGKLTDVEITITPAEVSDNSDALVTAKSVKSYVDAQVSGSWAWEEFN